MYTGFTSRHHARGSSAPPYDAFNLSPGVGDDPDSVERNRQVLAAEHGRKPDELVWMGQVHGADVRVVDGPVPGPLDGVDALVTCRPDLLLGVLTADCAPVLVTATGRDRVVAAVHAGRKGMAAGVVPAAVEVVRELGGERVEVTIGPCIGPCCYEVGEDVRAEAAAAVPESWAVTPAGTPALDIRAGIVAQLRALGVETIRHVTACTSCDPAYFSYRRDGRTGRQAGLVGLAGR